MSNTERKKPLYLQQNLLGCEEGAFKPLLGLAHQNLVAGILMRLGFYVSTFEFREAPYDLVIQAYKEFDFDRSKRELLRAQVRTFRESLRLTAGTRGGLDRPAGEPRVRKEYKYTTEHNDLIIGVDDETLDLYFVPTQLLDKWGKSVSKTKLQPLKNNIKILLNWNQQFLEQLKEQL